ncbi:MAG: tetrahydromethanopterin synthesis protein [Gammaproteobacteria bacterium]|nr:tetrahydromethanopterin synthesis protein [Gammaproteobacteria bacterium]|tara:strand:+ start:756 stop:1313 length:558 start_codon:yes stop_codon:yes gene_type:complete
MIHEVIVTTKSTEGEVHIAPMGIKMNQKEVFISPFKPSRTLENLISQKEAVINFIDDVRIFAGIICGIKKDWPLTDLKNIDVPRLKDANSHFETAVKEIFDDEVRPKVVCKISNKDIHAPFLGFNRAQFSVIEASVLVSRLGMISMEKILKEVEYLKIGFDKTSGPKEEEAWGWIQNKINNYKKE